MIVVICNGNRASRTTFVIYVCIVYDFDIRHSLTLHRSKHYTVNSNWTINNTLIVWHCFVRTIRCAWFAVIQLNEYIYSIVEFISEMLVNNTNAEMTMTHWNCQCTNELWMWLLWAMHIMFISRQDSIQYIEHSSYEQSLFVAAAINNKWCSVVEW